MCIRDSLKLARIDAGAIRLVHAPVDAAELVRRAFEPLAIAYDIADVAFDPHVQEGASYEGDLAWSVEALGNILKNCMEHTPAGGSVRLDATEDALACRIRVQDSGPGIDEADLPYIFERFYRGAAEETQKAQINPAGVGIGLALARSLVTAPVSYTHLDVYKRQGKGSRAVRMQHTLGYPARPHERLQPSLHGMLGGRIRPCAQPLILSLIHI